jgi:hypothetical protein
MLEIFTEAVSLYTLPFTVLLGICVLYWLLVLVGLLDMDGHGIDVGHDVHVGSDVHVGADVDVHAADLDAGHDLDSGDAHHEPMQMHHGPDAAHSALRSVLQFLNFGEVPAMIVVSILSLSAWTCSMIANHYFNTGSLVRALILLVPNLFLTVLLTKLLSTPLRKLFSTLNREFEEHKPVIGRTCTIITSEVTDKFGQAQIETSGAPIIINVRTYGETVLTKGESALVIKEDKENQLFTVAKLSTTTPQPETSIC